VRSGFINVSQNAKAVFFLGTFTARSRVAVRDGALVVDDTGAIPKFRDRVGQVTFNGRLAAERGQSGAPVLCDAQMVASGITRRRLPAGNDVVCTLNDPRVPDLATELRTTCSAAALELWRDRLEGAVVAISLTGGTQQVPVRCGDGRTVMRHASANWRSSS
jgi:hypothetical protein